MNDAIYTKNYLIEHRDTDFNQKLKLSNIFLYLQDIGTLQAMEFGVGREDLEPLNVIWVLVNTKLELYKHPKFNETITVKTWPQHMGKLEFERDYIIYDSNNNILAKAISSWVLIDIVNRKLKRSNILNTTLPSANIEKALDFSFQKLKSSGNLELVYKKMVRYSDIDINQHLNNTKYIDYIMDCFPLEFHKSFNIKSIEVNFLHEALPGDMISVYKDSNYQNDDKNKIYIEGINETNNKTAFKCILEIDKET